MGIQIIKVKKCLAVGSKARYDGSTFPFLTPSKQLLFHHPAMFNLSKIMLDLTAAPCLAQLMKMISNAPTIKNCPLLWELSLLPISFINYKLILYLFNIPMFSHKQSPSLASINGLTPPNKVFCIPWSFKIWLSWSQKPPWFHFVDGAREQLLEKLSYPSEACIVEYLKMGLPEQILCSGSTGGAPMVDECHQEYLIKFLFHQVSLLDGLIAQAENLKVLQIDLIPILWSFMPAKKHYNTIEEIKSDLKIEPSYESIVESDHHLILRVWRVIAPRMIMVFCSWRLPRRKILVIPQHVQKRIKNYGFSEQGLEIKILSLPECEKQFQVPVPERDINQRELRIYGSNWVESGEIISVLKWMRGGDCGSQQLLPLMTWECLLLRIKKETHHSSSFPHFPFHSAKPRISENSSTEGGMVAFEPKAGLHRKRCGKKKLLFGFTAENC
ncbi:hypothetical protein VP01_2578g1 [Puccinia sorghi]|uniref:Uncharacterized protein n=1 Tax=Puccinia sorghi TaxID=27349 RepID=A0A0L6V5I0_9BASI|nr:hypothetical protein VP01_2578g1 [Puccinia sorghi]